MIVFSTQERKYETKTFEPAVPGNVKLKLSNRECDNNIVNINSWLNCNKLSLNIDKTNFVIFHPPQKKITSTIKIFINQVQIKQETIVSTSI